jgi:hypothetical protein
MDIDPQELASDQKKKVPSTNDMPYIKQGRKKKTAFIAIRSTPTMSKKPLAVAKVQSASKAMHVSKTKSEKKVGKIPKSDASNGAKPLPRTASTKAKASKGTIPHQKSVSPMETKPTKGSASFSEAELSQDSELRKASDGKPLVKTNSKFGNTSQVSINFAVTPSEEKAAIPFAFDEPLQSSSPVKVPDADSQLFGQNVVNRLSQSAKSAAPKSPGPSHIKTIPNNTKNTNNLSIPSLRGPSLPPPKYLSQRPLKKDSVMLAKALTSQDTA